MRARLPVALASVGLVLTGCTPAPDPLGAVRSPDAAAFSSAITRDPVRALPPGLRSVELVQWDSPPSRVGDRAMGMLFPREGQDGLVFATLEATGPGWQVATSPSCVGFVVDRAEDRTIAVILDSNAAVDNGTLATRTVATAFDASTGKVAWGPVEVPGPALPGQGLVFADTPKTVLSDEPVARTMLDPHDGSVVVDGVDASTIALSGHGGVGVVERDGALEAVDTRTGATLWSEETLARPDSVSSRATPEKLDVVGEGAGAILLLEWSDEDGTTAIGAHDRESGGLLSVLAGPLAGPSSTSPDGAKTVLASRVADTTVVAVVDAETGASWERTYRGEATVAAAGVEGVFVRHGGRVVEVDWSGTTEVDHGDITAPVLVFPDGSGLFPTGETNQYALARPS